MTDGVISGTGNSRYLKSSISADTTLAQLITMLRDGTFPIDLNGLNAAGWTTLATALNKANLLSDATAAKIAAAMGVTAPTTVNEALSDIATPPIYQKLLSTTVGTAASSISLDLSGIALSNYSELIINAVVYTVYSTAINITVNNLTNANWRGAYFSTILTSENGVAAIGHMPTYANSGGTLDYPTPISAKMCTPYGTSDIGQIEMTVSGGNSATTSPIFGHYGKYIESALFSIQFISASGNIMAGSTFVVYGVKK